MTEPPITITTDSVSSRFKKHKKCSKKHAITASIVIFVLILSWCFGSQYAIYRDKRAIISYFSEEAGSNEWNIMKWDKPYTTENCQIYSHNNWHDVKSDTIAYKSWHDVKSDTIAYPILMEYKYLWVWKQNTMVMILRDGEVIGVCDREYWELPGVRRAREHMFDVAKELDEKRPIPKKWKYQFYYNRYDKVHSEARSIQLGSSLSDADDEMQRCESGLGSETMAAYDKYRKAVAASRDDGFWKYTMK